MTERSDLNETAKTAMADAGIEATRLKLGYARFISDYSWKAPADLLAAIEQSLSN
jgi:hypothetical protein